MDRWLNALDRKNGCLQKKARLMNRLLCVVEDAGLNAVPRNAQFWMLLMNAVNVEHIAKTLAIGMRYSENCGE